MIQQLENTFLTILRLAILVAACALLAATIILGISALPAIFPPPGPPDTQPQVKLETVIDTQFSVKPKTQRAEQRTFTFDSSRPVYVPDPDCQRMSENIAAFVSAYGDNGSVDKEEVTKFLENLVGRQPRRYREVFKKNLDLVLQGLVSNQQAIIHATATTPMSVVSKAITYFVAEFEDQVQQIQNDAERAQARHQAAKQAAWQRLVMAGTALASLLSTIFLLVFIRIERNLRPLAALTDSPQDPLSRAKH